MPETKGGTSAIAHVHSTAADRDQRGTDPVDSMDTAVSGEDKEDRTHKALQIAATSGFVNGIHGIQTSCLRLCNACRESVPVQLLKISDAVPRSIAALVCPGLRLPEKEESSRVLPHRWVLSVHWTFSYWKKAQITLKTSDDTDVAVVGYVDMSQVQWPQGTREVALCAFNRSLDDVRWPSGLERLCFGKGSRPCPQTYFLPDVFDKPLDGVTFPCGLREIFLGDRFNQPIEGIAWPGGLERLSLPGFNHSIRDVQWPPGLKSLEFVSPSRIRQWVHGWATEEDVDSILHNVEFSPSSLGQGYGCFNQVLGSTLPPSLERLWLSSVYEQPLDGVDWPNGIATLVLPFDFQSYRFRGIALPSSVETLLVLDTRNPGIRLIKSA